MKTVTTGNDESSDILRIMQQSQLVYYATSSNYNKHRNFANKYGFVVAASRYLGNDAVKNFDAEFEARRNRELGTFSYLILDAHYEKRRQNVKVASEAVLSAILVSAETAIVVFLVYLLPVRRRNPLERVPRKTH